MTPVWPKILGTDHQFAFHPHLDRGPSAVRNLEAYRFLGFALQNGCTLFDLALRHALPDDNPTLTEASYDRVPRRIRCLVMGSTGCFAKVSAEIEGISRTDENCINLMTIPGTGPMISTAMVAAIGQGEAFVCGRDFSIGDWLARMAWSMLRHKKAFDAQRGEVSIRVCAQVTQSSSRKIESMEQTKHAPKI